MKYGDMCEMTLVDRMTGKRIPYITRYRYVEYKEYHTDKEGYGLWRGNRQILGTCQFSVAGCKTEKAAKAKIRKYTKGYEDERN